MTDQATLDSKLSEYDFVIVVDTSGSMAEPVTAGATRSRWAAVQESAMTFVRDVEKLDSDGLGVVTFGGSTVIAKDGCKSADVAEIFAQKGPRGGTPLHSALEAAFKLAGKSDKKDFIVVFTDGVPDDEAAAAKLIRDQSNKIETDDALTVLFVQVGDDASATKYLRNLDDSLKGCKFDIVDAKTMAEADAFSSTAELVFAAIND